MRTHNKKLITWLAIFAIVGLNAIFRAAYSASLDAASDRLSDSSPGNAATHNVSFATHFALAGGEYFDVALPADFGDIPENSITCPATMTAATSSPKTARCTATGAIATGTYQITIASTTNPVAAGSQTITVASHQAGGAVIENAGVMVSINASVQMQARILSPISFSFSPVATSTDINGATTTMSSATTSMAFGTLVPGRSEIIGQELRVVTNGSTGFTMTTQQDYNLRNAGNSDIDSFIDGTSTAPQAWQAPAGSAGAEWTYGHFGFTSDDATLSGGDAFGDNLWQGFASTTPMEVMYHNGPADGETQNIGLAKVAYRIQISPLQEAGDYSGIITYVVTATY